jgi:hypothetical protein
VPVSHRSQFSDELRSSYARVEREDIVTFINACFACTRQAEFYSSGDEQAVSISFLHDYVLGNYRRVYSRCLAAGINHFNQSLIITNLLAAGAPIDSEERQEEGELIATALQKLPANRVFRLLKSLRDRRVNNRRTRAVVRRFLAERKDSTFDAVKYRSKYRAAAQHAHVNLPYEIGRFFFQPKNSNYVFETPLLESFRQAHYSQNALYELPFTVAEGFAAKHGIPRETFLKRIQPKMTRAEKLRLQTAAGRERGVRIEIDLGRTPLTKLALYALSLSVAERVKRQTELDEAMRNAARHALRIAPLKLNRVAAILDASYSAYGSTQKRRRPLAVALASSYLLGEAAEEFTPIWIPQGKTPASGWHELLVESRGQTRLGEPLIEALETRPDLVVIVSDGFENDPPGAASEVARVFRKRLDPDEATSIVHLNPVFDAEDYQPHALSEAFPTLGLRDAEDIPTMLGFAKFASGTAQLSELEDYLAARVQEVLGS